MQSFMRYWPAELNIDTFLRWWGAGLWSCLPVSLRQRYVRVARRWVLEITADDLVLCREQEGEKPEVLDRYPLRSLKQEGISEAVLKKTKGEPIVMRVPDAHTLSKLMSLPLAAENNLRQVVGFEIDRFTPFSAAQVYYDVRVLERQPAARRLQVQLIAVPRPVVDSLLEKLANAGLSPTGVDVAGCPAINLLPPEKRARQSVTLQRLQWGLAALGLILVLAAVFLPLWHQRNLVLELLPKVDAAQQEAETILTLRQELEKAVESSSFLPQKRKAHPLAIELVRELTTTLPDGTWVEYLDIRDGEMQIRGKSVQASTLIGLLEKSAYFKEVTFRSPITADRRTGKDRFHISAKVVGQS